MRGFILIVAVMLGSAGAANADSVTAERESATVVSMTKAQAISIARTCKAQSSLGRKVVELKREGSDEHSMLAGQDASNAHVITEAFKSGLGPKEFEDSFFDMCIKRILEES